MFMTFLLTFYQSTINIEAKIYQTRRTSQPKTHSNTLPLLILIIGHLELHSQKLTLTLFLSLLCSASIHSQYLIQKKNHACISSSSSFFCHKHTIEVCSFFSDTTRVVAPFFLLHFL